MGRKGGFARRAVRRLGYDVVRYPAPASGRPAPAKPAAAPTSRPAPKPAGEADGPAVPTGVPASELAEWRPLIAVMERMGIELLIDVGANEGQYARGIRACGFEGRIVSFEPVRAAYEVAAGHARTDPRWEVEQLALGREPGTAEINIAANAAQSSSILPMLGRHEAAAPYATYVGREEVTVQRLDDAVQADWVGSTPAFLKIDTQGFEREVLAGAPKLLAGPVRGVQLELSLVPLYEGGPLYLDLIETMRDAGFRLTRVVPGFCDRTTGEMLQFDGVFVRTGDA